jgi:hypothetical protein
MKKNIVIYANCQGKGILYYIKKSNNIINNYNIKHIRIDNLVFNKDNLNLNDIKNADVLIYQKLDDKHGDISTNTILNYIKSTCITLSFPYVYNNSFYPIKGPLIIEDKHLKKDCTIIYDNSKTILDLKKKNYSLEKIYDLYDNNQIDFLYGHRWNNTNSILSNNEIGCDLKILDFIKNNFSTERLFNIENHPTSIIFINLVNQILIKLDKNILEINEYGFDDAQLGGFLEYDNTANEYFKFKSFTYSNNVNKYYKKIIENIYKFEDLQKNINI